MYEDLSKKRKSEIQCLIYQAKTARNHYEREDCLDLIDEMRKVMERIVTVKEVTESINSMHKKRGDEMHTIYDEWQPIETAPVSTEILVGRFVNEEWRICQSGKYWENGNEYAGEFYRGYF